MGLLQRLFEKVGISAIPKTEAETIHMHDLLDWLEGISQEIVSKHQLEEESLYYFNALKNHRWLLESKLDSWKQAAVGSIVLLPDTEKLLELLLPQQNNVDNLLQLHIKLEPLLDRLSKENNSQNLPAAEQEIYSFVQQETQKINDLKDAFEQKVIQSGFSKVKNLMQKAALVDDTAERLRQMESQLQMKRNKLQQLEAKRREKEAELALLQQRPEYGSFIQVKPQRSRLLQEIETAPDLQQRFELREELHQLEKSIGNKDFLLKLDEAHYRLEHFALNEQKLQSDVAQQEDELSALKAKQQREIEFFINLVKVSLGKEIKVLA